jgi:CDP-glycerol glycerophosphotransferase
VTPDVSVIIAAYNAMPYVTKTVESLLRQTLGLDLLEIIAVDDGSTDGTGEELDRLAAHCPSMRVLHQPNSGGAAAPRNVALDLARGRYVFVLDADDYLGDEALARMVAVADEHRTDVVLGKMVGVGGRGVPQRMFRRNQYRTDVFNSDAFWAMNPTKLYRRELIERLGLRFDPSIVLGEDQPFVAMAYFNASAISILADYDYVYWVNRDDGQNMTKTVLDLESAYPSLEAMFSILASHVEPGPGRDRLAARLFEVETMNTFLARVAEEVDPARRERGFETCLLWLRQYYNEGVALLVPPFHRVCYHLIARGLSNEALTLLAIPRSDRGKPIITRTGRAYVALPFFGDSRVSVPDEAFDVTDRLLLRRSIGAVSWQPGGQLAIAFSVSVEGFAAEDVSARIVLRHRSGEHELSVPAEAALDTNPAALGQAAGVSAETAHLRAHLDPARLADGAALEHGRWDVWLQIGAGEAIRQFRPMGASVSSVRSHLEAGLCCPASGSAFVMTPYLTRDAGALALNVTPPARTLAPYVVLDPTVTPMPEPGVVAVGGKLALNNVPTDALWLRLEGKKSKPVSLSVDTTPDKAGPFRALIDARKAANGGPLPDGAWEVWLELYTSELRLRAPVPCTAEMPAIKWIRGAHKANMRVVPTRSGQLRIAVSAASLLRLIAQWFARRS